ncbi:RAD51-associated protein 1 [Trichechus manatus latirostris]|uniref:RAD51-associated protein 1 n=1 Tax=Trichechus manatus latirostris TaxID=127582 RepID=A0A2Y9FYF7_TRIMA|nr:RAD51-associated protein 1 [Trichechus manatus latirostris]
MRPVRHKKPVNYSQFEDSDSDGVEKMALDDKLYQRDLEVALALSVKETPTVRIDVSESQEKSIKKCGNSETETVTKSPHSEEDSDFGESEDNDEAFTVRKSKAKEIKKKEVKVKPPVEKKEKKPKSKCNALVNKIKWVPPGVSGSSSSNSRSPQPGVSVKSPNQSLRLGLSRLARVKPLHPAATSS